MQAPLRWRRFGLKGYKKNLPCTERVVQANHAVAWYSDHTPLTGASDNVSPFTEGTPRRNIFY
jgi:hypothetical protein